MTIGPSYTPQTCTNLRPGRCCQARMIPVFGQLADGTWDYSPGHEDYRIAQWTDLGLLDIAAVWRPTSPLATGACAGTPMATKTGPGAWRYPAGNGDAEETISGASYIRMPTALPKDGEASWLEAEGVLGLVTGGGKWVSSMANVNVRNNVGSRFLWLMGGDFSTKKKRDVIISPDKGAVFAQPPAKVYAVWADLIVINGTEYREESIGSSVYRSVGGLVLNLTDTQN
ncbi:MAG: hypothetical protein Q9220_003350 [cf. Caloplaca sp. 1 TL-2023]